MEAFASGDGFSTDVRAIRQRLGVGSDDRAEPSWDALRDLRAMGLVEPEAGHWIKITHEARGIRVT